ncbi:MAG: pyrroline-5-carboxylate reductase [Bacteroidia bacterium]|jgi:pyrroline-5-carboxylate reductase|nr:pyrroline-5-carboxylate reductase [Bacteroidia bacterium]
MRITLVGCGNMGLIYARAFIKYDIIKADKLLLVEKNAHRVEELEKLRLGTVVTPDNAAIGESELILIAVKPQDFPALAQSLQQHLKPGIVVLSIMAGITLAFLENLLQHKSLVRAMPNSPAGLGMGVTALIAHPATSAEQLRKAEHVLSTTGRTVFMEQESQLDAVTALSGSGPAYFFYIVKHMIEAGKAMGIDEGVAAMLVKQTMNGSFHLINQAEQSLDELIHAVTSKGGTTEAAFRVFEEQQIGENLQQAIFKAEQRAKELSKS